MTTKNTAIRKSLLARSKNRTCFYCGVHVVEHSSQWDRQHQDNQATLEHTISRFNPLRGKSQKYVIACLKCNREQSRKEHEALGLIKAARGKA